jgi:hypothetical protein
MSTGNLFNTKRIGRHEFEEYKNHVVELLKTNNVDFFIPYYYKDKQTFGDLDIIIPKPFGRENIIDIFRFNKTQYKQNSNIHSICYKDNQIDFITTKPNYYETTKYYYSWVDLSILLGRMYRKFNIKYGWDGLYFEYDTVINNHFRNIGTILLSLDFKQVLEFVGLDYEKFELGFETKNDIFDLVITSKYFIPKIYESVSQKSNKRSGIYDEIIEYSKDKEYQHNHTINFFLDKDYVYKTIGEYFTEVDILNKIKNIKEKEYIIQVNKDKFNGSIVMLLTGLKEKELVSFIQSFRIFVKENYEYLDFEKYVFETNAEHIKRDINLYFDEYKKLKL